jgi:hypothetical protein
MKQPELSDEDRRFLADFEAGALSPQDFHHRDHLRAAWATLRTYPLLEAIGRYVAAIKQLATAAGNPGIYHETITWAYLLLLHERLAKDENRDENSCGGAALPWPDFAARHADLFTWRPSLLDAYYRHGELDEELSRRIFVLPRLP